MDVKWIKPNQTYASIIVSWYVVYAQFAAAGSRIYDGALAVNDGSDGGMAVEST